MEPHSSSPHERLPNTSSAQHDESKLPRYKQQLKVIEQYRQQESMLSSYQPPDDSRRASAPGVSERPRAMISRRGASTESLFPKRHAPRGRRSPSGQLHRGPSPGHRGPSPGHRGGQLHRGSSPGHRGRTKSPSLHPHRDSSPGLRGRTKSPSPSPTFALLNFFVGGTTEQAPDPFDGELPTAGRRPPPLDRGSRPRSDLRIGRPRTSGCAYGRPPPSPLSPFFGSDMLSDETRPRSRPRDRRVVKKIDRHRSLDSMSMRRSSLGGSVSGCVSGFPQGSRRLSGPRSPFVGKSILEEEPRPGSRSRSRSTDNIPRHASLDSLARPSSKPPSSSSGLLATLAFRISPSSTKSREKRGGREGSQPGGLLESRGPRAGMMSPRDVFALALTKDTVDEDEEEEDNGNDNEAHLVTPQEWDNSDEPIKIEKVRSKGFIFSDLFQRRRPKSQVAEDDDSNCKPKTNVKKWSSIPSIPFITETETSGHFYPWQLAPPHQQQQRVESRRLELLEQDLASNPALTAEWMAVLKFRATQTFAPDPLDTAVAEACPRVGFLMLRIGKEANPTASSLVSSRIQVPSASPDSETIRFADADLWLYDEVQRKKLEPPGLLPAHIPNDAVLMREGRHRTTRRAIALVRYDWHDDAGRMETRRQELLALDIDSTRSLLDEWMSLLEARARNAKSSLAYKIL